MKDQELIYEHPKGAKLKLCYEYYRTKTGKYTHKKVLYWQAPKGRSWNVIGEWNSYTRKAHTEAFMNAQEALNHVSFDSLNDDSFLRKIINRIKSFFSDDYTRN